MKRFLKSITFCLLFLLITGCGEDSELKNGKDVLVSFNKEELNITVNDLYNKLKEDYGANYIIEIIDKKILDLEYPINDVITDYVNNQYEIIETSYGGTEKFNKTLLDYGYANGDEFKETLFLSYRRELALKDYVKSTITDKEIEKYYNNKIFGDITASHILITFKSDKTMTDDERREEEKKANETIKEIYEKLEKGSNFHDLAKEYSKDTSNASNGGRLGTFSQGEMESEFEKAAMKLEVGKYTTKAVKTSYGYHIIYKEQQNDKPTLKEVRQAIIDKLVEQNIKNDTKLQYKALIELREKYGIKINDEQLNDQYDTAINNWLYSKED